MDMGNTHNTSLARKSCDKSWQEYNTYFQAITADIFSKELITKEESKNIIRTLLGKEFARSRMVSVNGFINHNGRLATGMAADGYIYLAVLSKGVRFSSGYHEAMHIIWEDLIDPVARKKYEHLARKIALKETGKTLYGTELKEWMASDFAKRVAYRQNKLTHDDISESWRVNAKEMSLWQKFKAVMNDILNFFVKFRNRMDIFYDEILNGKYKEQNLSGNTYKYFEEETSDNFSIPEEEAYENDERTDKIRQYINLQKNIQTIFPDATQTLTRMENNIRYNMLKTCYLGNQYLPNIPNRHDMHQGLMDEIDSWEDYNEEVGNMQVLVNGTLTLVKDLKPDDYNNIEAPTGETLTERVNLAKSYMRTFYMSKRENVITVIQHMVPHFNPDDDYIRRTKNTNTQFEKDNYDPYTDGFTTELKLHMASIPKIRLLNGRLEINEETGGFIDQRAAENAYLYLGDKAREIYKLDYAKDPDQANMTTAFEKALANEINGLYDGQTNDDGTFKSVNLEVYVSLAMKFFGINVNALFDGNIYYNEDNTKFYPLKNIAGIIINKYKGKKIDTEIALAEMQRARHIAQFLSMFSTNAASKKLTNNSKQVISKVKEDVFTDTYVQYSKNIYDFINNNMKNALNGKFQFGMLYNKKAIKDIKRYIDIDEDNSISIAGEKFVTVRRNEKGLKRYIYTSNLNANRYISLYDIIKKSIGLPKNALSNRMLRRLFRENDNMPAAIRESIMNQAIKYTNFKLHDALNSMGARSMFEQYVANIIYANMAQITSFDLDITYSVNGQTEKYNRNADIREHVSALGDILQKNNDSTVTIKYKNDSGKFVSINGTGMSLLGKLFNEKFLVSKLPMLSPVYDYISKLGLQNVLKTGNADEYFTSIGIPLPTPAQFYPITEALAAYVASQTGNNKWQTVRTPNKKTKPVVQGSSIMNDIADGSASRMNMISAFYEQHEEAKALSPYFDKKGNSLIPYMSGNATGGTLSLDHVDSFMGLERNYGGQYTMGKNEINTHDFFLSAYNIFMSKVKKSTTYTQVIATPVMTISSTGKTYILNHIFRNEKGHIVNVTRTDNRTRVELNYELAKAQIVNQVKIIEREIELARQRFNDFINDVNAIIPEKNLHISLGVTEKTNKRDISRGEFIQNNAELIEKQLDKLPLELRMEIIEMARKSNLAKGKDIIIDDANLSFSMGEVVMDDIKDLTHGNNIYNKTNREALLKASDKEAEKVLKSIFRDDFISFVDYMTEIGLDAESSFVRNMIDDAFYDKENKTFEFYKKDASEVKSLNNSLFAFYMMFHISNNAFDILNGNPLSYKGVMDQVKRMGPQNTPIIHLDTNMQLDGNYIGSLPASGPAISIKNIMTEPQIKDDMKAIVDALDGSSIVSPLHRRMFDVSSGGSSYSIVGNTCMIKTLGLFKDPISGKVNQIKHAAKFITENDFNNSLAYKRMVIDLFKAQDKWLAENEHYKEVVKGTEFEGYSWYEHFAEYYNKTQSMDKAVDMLFDDLVQSQYYESYDINDEGNYIDYNGNLYTKDEIETKHKTLYTLLAKSVVYGYNPESVTKTTAIAINNYNPEDSQRDTEFSFSTIDYTGMGIVNSSDQPMNDSKKQSPYSQIMGLLGYSDYKLSGANGNPGNKNPGIAIMQKQNELYYEGMRLINAEINAIVPHNVEWKEGMPKFADVDWVNVDSDTRDLSYALAQLEGFMRDIAKAGMADAAIQGNYVEMLSDVGISRQFPQIRNKLIQTYRNYINTHALKRGMNGMRATQASGVFHRLYYLKGDENGMPYTRQEALEHINIYKETIEDIDAIEERLAEKFDIKGLNDMRVENGETKRGQVIMPYAYARTLGLRMKGEEGATKDETLRDLFSLSMQEGKVDIRTMGLTELLYHLGSNEFTDDVAESPLVRAALRNLRRVKNNRQYAHLRTDEFVELEGMLENLAEEIITLRDSAIDTLKVFAVRTPSNGLGNGAWYDIAGFHGDGNVIYIPVGMTLLNNSDFDIDQLAVYFKKLDKRGHKLNDTTNRLFNDVLDITEEVYMAKANQPDIFIESSIKEIKKIANEVSKDAAPTPYNSAYSLLKSYEENRVGDRAIGILVNTLSAAVYLSTLNEINKKIVPGTEADNPMSAIVSKARKSMRGKESLIIMVGDWLQAALDNPKENALGKYGVTEESIPILGLMIAKGPRIDPKTKKIETTEEFFRRVKAFFNDYTVHNKFAEEALSNSLYMDRRGKDLYSSIQKHLYNIREKIKAHPLRNMSQVDKIASPKEVKDFVKANMLADINAYRALMDFEGSIEMSNDMTEAEEERYNTALEEYIRSIDLKKKNPSEEEQRQIKTYLEYRNLTTRVAGAQQRKGLQQALEALEELDEYIAQAIALRNVSRLVSLRQGLPGKDSDRAFLIKEIELIFGTDLKSIIAGDSVTEEQFIDYFKRNSNQYVLAPNSESQRMLLDKAVRAFRMINLSEYLKSNPMTRVHLTELLREQNIASKMFSVDSPFYKSIEKSYIAKIGLNAWSQKTQWSTFMEAFSELALDRYFERYWNKTISIALPSNLGGKYIEGDGILSQLNLSNIHHREIFSLMFPEIIELLQTSYISAEDMEAAFMAISPEFAGISESFFDKDGRRINNAFADVLTKVGSNERYYAGFELSTSEISDEARVSIQEGFSMLPEALKQLFLANEIIANKMYYKKGSISDAIGVDIFRGGLSEIYNEFYDDVSAGNVFENAEMEERFYDYVSTLSGMTPYVEESKIGLENNTEYFHTYKRAGDGSYTVHYKQRAEDADAKPIYKLTPRAGITMDPRYSIISNIPYLTLTGEELVELEDGDKPITKFYIKGHGYKRGYYITEMGTSVHVNPEGNIVTITKKEIPENYTRQETPMQEYDDYVFDERYANKESNLPTSDETINIYASSNQNAELSNFAIRPFTTNVETSSGEKQYTFQSVEQGFHFHKALVANNPQVAKQVLATTNGGQLKRLTNRSNLNMTSEQVKEWDDTSKSIMLNLMYESYAQNPKAAEKLLATGNAKITHTQDTTRWKTDFPEVVMTVRDMLREEGFGNKESDNIEILTSNYTRQSVQNDTNSLYLFTDNAQRTSRPTANEENVDKNSWYYKKYKSQTNKPIHFGSTSNPTSAVIRGLNNAYPISTMSAYGTNWTDSNFELFKQTIDDEIAQIKKDLPKFSKVKIGDFRIGQGGRYAKLPQQHQQYLDNKLLEIGIDNTGNKPKIINSQITPQQKQQAQQQRQQPKVRNIESYMEERINLINEIINSNKSELPVEVLSEMSMDQLRNILKC